MESPKSQGTINTAESREAIFWDQAADRVTIEELSGRFDTNNPLGRCLLELLGDLRGKRVLDVGCGTGQWSVVLAALGAEVSAIDISPRSVAVTIRRAQVQGVSARIRAAVMSATALEFAEGSFDRVFGRDIIHHLDAPSFGRSVSRVLAPGGKAVFSENCANNPLLMLARNRLCGRFGIAKWSSDDEYPLTREKLATFSQFFPQTSVYFPEFLCFHYFDAKLFHYRSRAVSGVCRSVDKGIFRLLPLLRQYSYRQVICCSQTGG